MAAFPRIIFPSFPNIGEWPPSAEELRYRGYEVIEDNKTNLSSSAPLTSSSSSTSSSTTSSSKKPTKRKLASAKYVRGALAIVCQLSPRAHAAGASLFYLHQQSHGIDSATAQSHPQPLSRHTVVRRRGVVQVPPRLPRGRVYQHPGSTERCGATLLEPPLAVPCHQNQLPRAAQVPAYQGHRGKVQRLRGHQQARPSTNASRC